MYFSKMFLYTSGHIFMGQKSHVLRPNGGLQYLISC